MTDGQSLADGAAGTALLHLETGERAAAFTALQEAVAEGATVADNASLYYGAPAIAFVLAASSWPELAGAAGVAADGTAIVTRRKLGAAHRRIDERRRPDYSEYDLIRGLTGLGVVLRRIGNHDLLHDVLTYLVRLTETLRSLPGWWCSNGPSRDQPDPAGGHGNHGLAHGITGPLALLALTYLDGVHVEGQVAAMNRILSWLDVWEQRSIDGAAWWPQTLTRAELEHRTPKQPGPGRASWCYGTPGVARAVQLAARAVDDALRQRHAEVAFAACIADPAQTGLLTDRGLCHGTAGLLSTGRHIAADALTPIPLAHLRALHDATAAGDEGAGFLDGRTGADLVTAGRATAWDECLLLC